MEVLASMIRQEKDTEGIQFGKEDNIKPSLFADDKKLSEPINEFNRVAG